MITSDCSWTACEGRGQGLLKELHSGSSSSKARQILLTGSDFTQGHFNVGTALESTLVHSSCKNAWSLRRQPTNLALQSRCCLRRTRGTSDPKDRCKSVVTCHRFTEPQRPSATWIYAYYWLQPPGTNARRLVRGEVTVNSTVWFFWPLFILKWSFNSSVFYLAKDPISKKVGVASGYESL